MTTLDYNDAPTLDVALRRVSDWLEAERDAARTRMLALGMTASETAQLLKVAEAMHRAQLAWVERVALERVGLISRH